MVPAEAIEPRGAGLATARLFGVAAGLRCAPDQAAVAGAQVCLKARDLKLAEAGEDAIAATVSRLVYRGGHFRLEAEVNASPGTMLRLEVGEPCSLAPGDAIGIAVRDGWVLPA